MRLTFLGIVLAIVSGASAQGFSRSCPSSANGACYSVNVPDATAAGTQKDIYFQITGPSSSQWIGLGQGGQTRMRNSNIFIIYADASGTNVTLSPRLGVGEVEPQFNGNAQVSLLGGSGIANGQMTANVRCSSCADWGSGSMDLTARSTPWIWAVKGGSAIGQNSQSASLFQHDIMGKINFDLTTARGGNSLNPFAARTTATGTGAGSAPTAAVSGGDSDSLGASSDDGGVDRKMILRATIAHGTIMGLAFALLFPIGGIIIRVFSFPGLVWVHAGMQLFTYALTVAGLGLGVYIAIKPSSQINHYHPIIGLVVVGLLAIQPFGGLAHHSHYKKYNRRSIYSDLHVWFGRALITLGIINGGLGLKFAGNTRKGEIAYGVVAGIVWLTWMAVAGFHAVKSDKNAIKGERREKVADSPAGSEEGRTRFK